MHWVVFVVPPVAPEPCKFMADNAAATALFNEVLELGVNVMVIVLLVGETETPPVYAVPPLKANVAPLTTPVEPPGRATLVVCPAAAAATAAVPWVTN